MRDARIVCFDLGGVIVRICRSWEEGCARAGVALRDHERFMLGAHVSARSGHTDAHQRGDLSIRDYCAAIARASASIYDEREIDLVHAAWIIGEYPGVRELIDELNASPGVRTACLSNTNAAHWDQMLGRDARGPVIPALACIAHPVASHHARLVKPDEEFYRYFERRLGASPESIIFFDDLEENVDAARRFGWDAHRVDPEGDTARQMRETLRGRGVL